MGTLKGITLCPKLEFVNFYICTKVITFRFKSCRIQQLLNCAVVLDSTKLHLKKSMVESGYCSIEHYTVIFTTVNLFCNSWTNAQYWLNLVLTLKRHNQLLKTYLTVLEQWTASTLQLKMYRGVKPAEPSGAPFGYSGAFFLPQTWVCSFRLATKNLIVAIMYSVLFIARKYRYMALPNIYQAHLKKQFVEFWQINSKSQEPNTPPQHLRCTTNWAQQVQTLSNLKNLKNLKDPAERRS